MDRCYIYVCLFFSFGSKIKWEEIKRHKPRRRKPPFHNLQCQHWYKQNHPCALKENSYHTEKNAHLHWSYPAAILPWKSMIRQEFNFPDPAILPCVSCQWALRVSLGSPRIVRNYTQTCLMFSFPLCHCTSKRFYSWPIEPGYLFHLKGVFVHVCARVACACACMPLCVFTSS